jgi:hypothetical protein
VATLITGNGVDKIIDGTITNADINASAAIAGSKLSGAGKVLQVVSNTLTTVGTTTSSTMSSLGLSQSITPISTSSKVYALVTGGNAQTDANDVGTVFTLYRGSTDLNTSTTGMVITYTASAGYSTTSWSMQKLDSPSTTSATTYSVYWRTRDNGNTSRNHPLGGETTLTLMEIGA